MREPIFRYIGDKFYPVPHFPLAVISSWHPIPVPNHAHDFAEFVFVREGSATHITDDGNVQRRVERGDVLLLGHGERHAYADLSGFEIDNLMFRNDLFEGRMRSSLMDAFATIESLFRTPLADRTVHLDAIQYQQVYRCLVDIRTELAERRVGFRSMALARFVEAIVIVGRASRPHLDAFASRTVAGQSSELSIAAADEFMRLHFAEPLTLAEVAGAASLSPTHFCAVFKSDHGTTPWQYLHELRIAHATYLLDAQPTMSIAQVSDAAGFTEPGYFGRVFRASTGLSPSAYRKAKSQDSSDLP